MTLAVDWAVKPQHKQTKTNFEIIPHHGVILVKIVLEDKTLLQLDLVHFVELVVVFVHIGRFQCSRCVQALW